MTEAPQKKIKLSRTKNAVRNIYSGLFNKIFTILFPFLIRTILIKKIGIEYAGLNSLFSSILQVLNLTELGFASAVVYSMYKPIAENDKETICALLNFYKRVYFIIGLVILAIGTTIMPFLKHLIKGSVPQDINIYILYSIYLLNTSLSYLLFGYKNSLLNAHQRRDVISNILTITQGLMNICQIVILLTIKSYYLYVIMMPIFTILNNILVGIITKRMFPEYSCRGKLDISIQKDIRKKVAGLMISKLAQTSRNSFDSIFISAFIGLSMTAIYSNYMLVFTSLTGIINIITNSMQAGVGNFIQTETKEKNYELLKKLTLFYALAIGWCTTCMLCIYQPFIATWLGESFKLPFVIVIMICVYFYLLISAHGCSLFYHGCGMWWNGKYLAATEALVNIIGNYIFVKNFGLYGIVLATIISTLIGNIWMLSILFKLFFTNKKMLKFFLFNAFLTLASLLLCILTFLINKILATQNNFITALLVTGFSATVLFFAAYMLISKLLHLQIPLKIFRHKKHSK